MTASSRAQPRFSAEFRARYEVLGLLGEGGMGAVWRARQLDLNRQVAIKVLHSVGPEDVERFRREGRTLAGLDHPHIVRVFDAGEDEGQPCFACELVEGPTLDRLIASGALPPEVALEALAQVADALAYAHEQGASPRVRRPGSGLTRCSSPTTGPGYWRSTTGPTRSRRSSRSASWDGSGTATSWRG